MKHYLKRLEESVKEHWNNPALGNYGGEKTVTFKIGARSITDWFDEAFQYWK